MSDYLQSTSLEIGAALLLAAPLILVERLMELRIKTVETEVQSVADDVQRTQTKIDQLGQETPSRIAAARHSDEELRVTTPSPPPARGRLGGRRRPPGAGRFRRGGHAHGPVI